ncbi:MAG TPA: PepSY-associated TM helix domain-containing protein [Labilithrix sp.]
MADGSTSSTKTRKKFAWRAWLRATHRDVGYVAVGLTFIYALSGIAVNHITDWSDGDPSFASYSKTVELGPIAGADEKAVADEVRKKLAIAAAPREVYRESPDDIEVLFDKRTLHVNPLTGHVVDEGQKPRFILRVANWLHLNRGKKAWTYVADSYAAALLLLATSGMFMIAGRKGLLGRGAILVGIGIAVPVVYVTLAGP